MDQVQKRRNESGRWTLRDSHRALTNGGLDDQKRYNVELLIVGGGGTGGQTIFGQNGGGGGGGGIVYSDSLELVAGCQYPVVVGAAGSTSSFCLSHCGVIFCAFGGGAGAQPFHNGYVTGAAVPGGSGGGGTYSGAGINPYSPSEKSQSRAYRRIADGGRSTQATYIASLGFPNVRGYGNPGGHSNGAGDGCGGGFTSGGGSTGGGGGAGAAGQPGATTAGYQAPSGYGGDGGEGLYFNISGSMVGYGGGSGGSTTPGGWTGQPAHPGGPGGGPDVFFPFGCANCENPPGAAGPGWYRNALRNGGQSAVDFGAGITMFCGQQIQVGEGGQTHWMGQPGVANRGGAGGVSSGGGPRNPGGCPGGSGVVILRYPGGQRGTGGNTITTSTSPFTYTVHTFTGSGTFCA